MQLNNQTTEALMQMHTANLDFNRKRMLMCSFPAQVTDAFFVNNTIHRNQICPGKKKTPELRNYGSGVHRFSQNLGATSKLSVPEG